MEKASGETCRAAEHQPQDEGQRGAATEIRLHAAHLHVEDIDRDVP
jgi:hypothetical protein